ncbi:MAG TPA: hypothetical protein VFO10_11225 [Oligoflexus sp.]|nr:hypothetical protein [Oligoflexus sp.]HET9237816.1 hypothetical protein [Oligoflexus sp.]
MLLEIDFAKKKKKPAPPAAIVMPLYPGLPEPQAKKKKKDVEHLTLSI